MLGSRWTIVKQRESVLSDIRHGFENSMFLRESARDGRPAVLWIHGLGESGLCFESIVRHPRLGGFRHLIPDLPGYGRSFHPERPPSFAETADRLERWLEARGEPPLALAGHSLGGVLALILAERHPARVLAVADIDGNKSAGDCVFSSRAAECDAERFSEDVFPELLENIYRGGMDDDALRGYYASLRFCRPEVFHHHALELLELSTGEGLARRLAALPCPVRFIAGSPRGVCPRSLELLHGAGVPVASVSPSGHWPFIDRPNDFAKILTRFLEGVKEGTQ